MSTEREQFLAEWRSGVGGSDAGVIAGFSPFKTPLELWGEKLGMIDTDDISEREVIIWGNKLEPLIAERFTEVTGIATHKSVAVQRHPDLPWMLAHLDFDVDDPDALLECKTAGYRNLHKWGPDGSDEVPEEYLCQTQHYMGVTGRKIAYLAVLIGGQDFRTYVVPRDDELIELLISQESDFQQCVITSTPPPIDLDGARAVTALKRIYKGTNGQSVDLSDVAHWHSVLQEANGHRQDYEKAADVARAHIMKTMGDAAIGVLPDGTTYTRKAVTRKGYTVNGCTYIDMRYTKKGLEPS